MFLSRMTRFHLSVLAGLAVAATALLLAPAPAAAEQPGNYPRIPPDAKGYQVVQIQQDYLRNRHRQATSGATQPAARSTSEVSSPHVVIYERPDGWAQTYVLEGSSPAGEPIVQRAPGGEETRVVTFQGPDGTVRTFVLQGSIKTRQPETVIVRQKSK